MLEIFDLFNSPGHSPVNYSSIVQSGPVQIIPCGIKKLAYKKWKSNYWVFNFFYGYRFLRIAENLHFRGYLISCFVKVSTHVQTNFKYAIRWTFMFVVNLKPRISWKLLNPQYPWSVINIHKRQTYWNEHFTKDRLIDRWLLYTALAQQGYITKYDDQPNACACLVSW